MASLIVKQINNQLFRVPILSFPFLPLCNLTSIVPLRYYFVSNYTNRIIPCSLIIHRSNAHSKSSLRGSIQPSSAREQNALAEHSRRQRLSIRVLEGLSGTSELPDSPMPLARAQTLADERNLQLVKVSSFLILFISFLRLIASFPSFNCF